VAQVHELVLSAHSIDLSWLRRRGILRKGWIGGSTTLTWSLEKSGSIRVLAQADGLRLTYTVTAHDGTKISGDELVPFAYTATRFGGRAATAYLHQVRSILP